MIPSPAYHTYEVSTVPLLRLAMAQLRRCTWVDIPHRLSAVSGASMEGPISRPVELRALVYRDADRGDLVGYLQAISDLLQAGGVIQDDRLIYSYDGSRLLLDRQRPRVELVLSW
jgi:hypothetical protein